MFEWIDSLYPWVEMLACFILGVWAGRRWSRVKHEAECRARNCETIQKMRTEKMQLAADKKTIENSNEFMREVIQAKVREIHSLRTSNGIMGQSIQALTYQIQRPRRKMVA